jgi:hypothetical protein
MFPTPRAANWATGSLRDTEKITDPRGRLEDFVVMYPTPRASDSDKELRTPGGAMKEMSRGHGISLSSHVRLYPTPTIHGNYNRKGASQGSGDGLETFVKLYPTPTCNDPEISARKSRGDSKNNNPPSQRTENGRHSDQLNVVAGGSLNPLWVEWLMGFPIGWTNIGG